MTLALPSLLQAGNWPDGLLGSVISVSAFTVALAGSIATTRANPSARVTLIHFFTVFILETS
ncbi:hypothetical protein [Stutzerimonas stutzeri]|uniref:hypothetical protein n=1 Tax=Stutzerimonas stutzeri TaxID=316 RepID=UPI001CFD616C|nr:hypothetical protein [Stutzerimonas stutzeri]